MNQCSRHRSNVQPTQTPEGFWDLEFLDEKPGGREIEKQKRADLQPMKVREHNVCL